MPEQTHTESEDDQSLTKDPVYFIMAGVFAFLTTVLPVALGQPRTMPVVQAAVLTLFAAFPLCAGHWRRSALLVTVWLAFTFILVTIFTLIAPGYVESTLSGGFEFRSQLLEWVYGVAGYPSWHGTDPATLALMSAAFVVGSLVTAGLVGYWFVFQQVNHLAYAFGLVWSTVGGSKGLPGAIPWWGILQVVGLAGLVILLSEPLLGNSWSIRRYWSGQKALIIVSLVALTVGLLLSIIVPPLLQNFIVPQS